MPSEYDEGCIRGHVLIHGAKELRHHDLEAVKSKASASQSVCARALKTCEACGMLSCTKA